MTLHWNLLQLHKIYLKEGICEKEWSDNSKEERIHFSYLIWKVRFIQTIWHLPGYKYIVPGSRVDVLEIEPTLSGNLIYEKDTSDHWEQG